VAGADATTAGDYTLDLFLPGDVDGDGAINLADSQAVTSALGQHLGDPGYIAGADTNQDGLIDATDVQVVAASFGAAANRQPVATPGSAGTHRDLQVAVPLVASISDPEDDLLFVRIGRVENGTARLSGDGQSVIFTPTPGFTGVAGFDIQADDGYGTSAPAT